MNWQEVCEDPTLQNLPYKIELNERGQIIMSPMKVYHSGFQGELIRQLLNLTKEGKAIPECAIKTRKGTKVADAVWCSSEVWRQIKHETESSIAPEICIEVLSASNTDEEMQEKQLLYFEQGAKEFWLCDEKGDITFYNSQGRINPSTLIPTFPHHIET